jgi:hypothetical protein
MGKRSRRRSTGEPVATTDYRDADGNVLTLRDELRGSLPAEDARLGASADDVWRRRTELLFERYVVRWEIAGLPLEKQKDLLGRYRMADQATQQWVRQTIDRHIESA